jgi:hypothetical protein
VDSTNPLPATPPSPAEELPPIVTSPILDAGDAAYYRDLPELVKTHHHWWVVYHGERRIALAKTHQEAYQLFKSQGLPRHDVVIACVEDEPDYDFIGLGG